MPIWKFPLKTLPGLQDVVLPEGAKLLTVQMQHGTPMLWAVVDPHAPNLEVRQIELVSTGASPPANSTYISTYQVYGGAGVYHAFVVVAYGVDAVAVDR